MNQKFNCIRAVPKKIVPFTDGNGFFFCRGLWVKPSVLVKEIAFFPGRVVGQNQLPSVRVRIFFFATTITLFVTYFVLVV